MQIVNSIPSPPPKLVAVKDFDFDPNLYYGVKIGRDVGVIHRENYNSGLFSIFCLQYFTKGNRITSFDAIDLKSIIKSILAYGDERPKTVVKVCAFQTFPELLAFLNTESQP